MTASLAAFRAELEKHPAWSGAPPPTDDFLLLFLRAEMFSTVKAAQRYRLFWKVRRNRDGSPRPRALGWIHSPRPPESKPA